MCHLALGQELRQLSHQPLPARTDQRGPADNPGGRQCTGMRVVPIGAECHPGLRCVAPGGQGGECVPDGWVPGEGCAEHHLTRQSTAGHCLQPDYCPSLCHGKVAHGRQWLPRTRSPATIPCVSHLAACSCSGASGDKTASGEVGDTGQSRQRTERQHRRDSRCRRPPPRGRTALPSAGQSSPMCISPAATPL